MPIGANRYAIQAPGFGQLAPVTQDPGAVAAIQKLYAVSALGYLGLRWPYNNASTAVSNISAHTLLSPTRGRLEYNELNINGSYTMTFSTSPVILCAHKLYGPSGAILDMDGMGAAGGPGFSGGASAAGGQADRGVSGGQNFA
ncbi:MAG TPA: hypothetical protein PKW35_02240, partial [Nannocystaceae bacterium]|nr:hypothetical protein [Nannocystaceae bacterium]